MHKLPNFFIVGAPRAGTTALYQYLINHPDVFLPVIKEPHYFGKDLEFSINRISFDRYKELFEPVVNKKAIGEGSVMYLMSNTAANEIKAVCPDAKIIIMLRHPVDLVISLHQKMLLSGNENISDIEQAIKFESARKKGKKLPPLVHRKSLLYYSDVVKFAEQVQNYLNVFGTDNVHIILFDDFKSNTEKIYKKVLNFLDISENFLPYFEIINQTKILRFPLIRNLKVKIQLHSPTKIKKIIRNYTPDRLRFKLYDITTRLNTADNLCMEKSFEIKKRLHHRYRINIIELANILDKDLSTWLYKY